jgi:hypothetical protein
VDNSYLSLEQPVFDQLRDLIEEARAHRVGDGFQISRYQAGLWADFEDLADETEQAVSWRSAVAGLLELPDLAPVEVPAGVHAELRPYQQEGSTGSPSSGGTSSAASSPTTWAWARPSRPSR